MRKCIITITPDSTNKADIQTGGVTYLEILDALKGAMTVLSMKLCQEFEELHKKKANEHPADFENWVKFLRDSRL